MPLGQIDAESLSFRQIEIGRALCTLEVNFALLGKEEKEDRRLLFKTGVESQVEWAILSSLQHMVLRETVPKPVAFFSSDSVKSGCGSGLLALCKSPTVSKEGDEHPRKRIFSIAESDSLEDWELFLQTLAKIQVAFASKVDTLRSAGCRDASSIMRDRRAVCISLVAL